MIYIILEKKLSYQLINSITQSLLFFLSFVGVLIKNITIKYNELCPFSLNLYWRISIQYTQKLEFTFLLDISSITCSIIINQGENLLFSESLIIFFDF